MLQKYVTFSWMIRHGKILHQTERSIQKQQKKHGIPQRSLLKKGHPFKTLQKCSRMFIAQYGICFMWLLAFWTWNPLRRPLYQQLIVHDSDELIRIPWACCWFESSTDMSPTVSNSLQVSAYNKISKTQQMTNTLKKNIQIHKQHNHNPKFCILWKIHQLPNLTHPPHTSTPQCSASFMGGLQRTPSGHSMNSWWKTTRSLW